MVAIHIPRRSLLKVGCAFGAGAAAMYARRLDWAQWQNEAHADQGGLGGGNSCGARDITRQAYGLNSWLNQPIGLNAEYGNSAVFNNTSTDEDVGVLQGLATTDNATVHYGDNNAQMWLVSTASDPLVQWNDTSSSSSPDYAGSNLVHVPAFYTMPGNVTSSNPTGKTATIPYGGTQHLSVIDTAQGIVAHGYKCAFYSDATGSEAYTYGAPAPTDATGGKMQFDLGRIDDLYGDGISPTTNSNMKATRQNRYGWGNGAIRIEDVIDFYGVNQQRMDSIRHVLRYALSFMYMQGYAMTQANDQGWQWPEIAIDYCYDKTSAASQGTGLAFAYYNYSVCATGSGQYTAAKQIGITGGGMAPALFLAIPTIAAGGPDITTITNPNNSYNPLTKEGLALAWTLQNYGLAWRDSTGGHQIALKCDPRMGAAVANSTDPYKMPYVPLAARNAYSTQTAQFLANITLDWPCLVHYLSIIRNYSNGSDGLVPFAGGGGFVTSSAPARYGAGDSI